MNTVRLMPRNIESVIVVKRDLTSDKARKGRTRVESRFVDGKTILVFIDEQGNIHERPPGRFEDFCVAWNAALLNWVDYGRFAHRWCDQSEKLIATISGARNFRADDGMKPISYDGCVFLVFSEPLIPRLIDELRPFAEAGNGNRDKSPVVVTADIGSPGMHVTLYFQQISERVVAVTTDRQLMQDILETDRARPKVSWLEETPEWKYIAPDAPIWALRHYRVESRRERTSLLRVDPRAIGIAVNYGANGDRSKIVAHYLCNSAAAMSTIKGLYRPDIIGTAIGIDAPGRGRIEVVLDVERTREKLFCFQQMKAPLGYSDFYSLR